MMSEWKLVDVEGIGSGYACLTLDGVSTTKSRNLIQADRGAGGDGLGFSDLGTLLNNVKISTQFNEKIVDCET